MVEVVGNEAARHRHAFDLRHVLGREAVRVVAEAGRVHAAELHRAVAGAAVVGHVEAVGLAASGLADQHHLHVDAAQRVDDGLARGTGARPGEDEHARQIQVRKQLPARLLEPAGRGGKEVVRLQAGAGHRIDLGVLAVELQLAEDLAKGRDASDHVAGLRGDGQIAAAVVAQIEHEVRHLGVVQFAHCVDQPALGRRDVRVELEVADRAAVRLQHAHALHRRGGYRGRRHGHRARVGGPQIAHGEPVRLARRARKQACVEGGGMPVLDAHAVHFQNRGAALQVGLRRRRVRLRVGDAHKAGGSGRKNRESRPIAGGDAGAHPGAASRSVFGEVEAVLVGAGGRSGQGPQAPEVVRRRAAGRLDVQYLVVPEVGVVAPGAQPVVLVLHRALHVGKRPALGV